MNSKYAKKDHSLFSVHVPHWIIEKIRAEGEKPRAVIENAIVEYFEKLFGGSYE